VHDIGSVGRPSRDPWSWSASGPSGNDDVLSAEELREIRIDVEGPILTTTADDEADAVVRGGWRAALAYVDPPMYGSWEAL